MVYGKDIYGSGSANGGSELKQHCPFPVGALLVTGFCAGCVPWVLMSLKSELSCTGYFFNFNLIQQVIFLLPF